MSRRRSPALPLSLALTALPLLACVDVDAPEPDLGEAAQEIGGGWSTRSPEGAVSLTGLGTAPRTGVLVAPNLVLTHDTVVRGARAGQLTVSWGVGLSPPSTATQSRAGRHLNFHDSGRFALIQTAGAVVNRPLDAVTVTRRTPAQLANTTVTCKAYSANGSLRRTTLTLGVVDGALRGALPPLGGHVLEPSDVGGPCIDGTELVGVIGAVDARTNVATVLAVDGLAAWIDNMTFLAQVRDDARSWGSNVSGPATLSFVAPNATRMCLNVPSGWVHAQAPVNQYPCQASDDAKNEQVYLVPVDSTHQLIVFDHSGLCLNVPGGSTAAPLGLQQYPCQTLALNDRWGLELHPTGVGIRLWPQSAATRSLGGQAGAAGGTPSLPVQQQSAGTPAPGNQRWSITWKQVR